MKSPFKFLDSYTKDDRDIFFGRAREIKELYQCLFESNIMLVYGVSGTGKSSLVHCGLANKINETDWLPVPIRRGNNIIESMAEGIRTASITPQQTKLKTPADFKKGVRSLYLDYYKLVFFIFDQFEELFIFGDKEERREFIQIVKSLSDRDLHCHFIFIMREEYMAGITEFEKYIPTIFSNRVRIEKMSHQNAAEAITGPCKVFNINVEDGFPEALLEKLSPGREDVELTYLQVFLDKIFRLALQKIPPFRGAGGSESPQAGGSESPEAGNSSPTFTLALLEKTGNVSDLLGSFLDEQISLLPDPEMALTVLKAFVSAKGTKRSVNAEKVREYALATGRELNEDVINDLLHSLVNLRILQDRDSSGRHELKHDALASKIFEKITLVEKELLEVRQFIENSFHEWQKREVFLSEEDLKYIAPYETRLFLPEDHKKFIGKSKYELTRVRRRRRNIVSAASLLLIITLSVLSIWAISEKKNAVDKERIATEERIKAKASAEEAIIAMDRAIESDSMAVASEKEAIKARDAAKDSEKRAIFEKTIAEKRETEARANNFNYLSKEIAADDPTMALRLAEYALSIDPHNKAILNNLNSIYNYNSFYNIFFEHRTGEICRISPDWSTVASTKGCSAKLTDLNGNYTRTLLGHRIYALTYEDVHPSRRSMYDLILFLTFSDDGHYILTGSNDRTVRLWDLDGNMLQIFRGHNSYIRTGAFSPDGEKMVTGSGDRTARLWDRKGNCLQVFSGHESDIYSLAFSPDGKKLLTGSGDSTAILWDLEGNVLQQFKGHSDIVRCVAFSRDGKTILTGSNDNTVRLWDLNSNLIRVFSGHTDNIMSIAFSPDGKTILTGSADKTARLWDLDGNSLLTLKGHKYGVNSVVFSADGMKALTFCGDGNARIWDLSQSKFIDLTGQKGAVITALFSPDATSILTLSEIPDPSLKFWDLDGKCTQTLKFFANTAAFSPDGKTILIGGLNAQLLDLEGKILKNFVGHYMDVLAVAFAPDGKTILTGGIDKTARLWDLSGKTIKILAGHSDAVYTAAYSPDNKTIVTGSKDKTARLWDIDGNFLQVFTGHSEMINSACFSPDGKTILTCSDDNTARLWDLHGNTVQILSGHTRGVNSCAFSPDGEKIITGSSDNTARVWDLSGNTLQVVRGFSKPVLSVAFSPDGKRILVGSSDNIARLVEMKKPVGLFLNEETLGKLSMEQELNYGIMKLEQLKQVMDIAKLFDGLRYCLDHARNQDNQRDEYLNTATILLKKTETSISNEYYRKQFISCGIDLYQQQPQKLVSDKLNEACKKDLSASTITDLRNTYDFYSETCSDPDPVSVLFNLPETYLQIAEKLMLADTSARRTISIDLVELSWSLLKKGIYKTSMDAIELAVKADTTNLFARMTLPLALILNNRFDEARGIYLKYYQTSAFSPAYGYYKTIYLNDMDELERLGITHPDFEKVKELLKN